MKCYQTNVQKIVKVTNYHHTVKCFVRTFCVIYKELHAATTSRSLSENRCICKQESTFQKSYKHLYLSIYTCTYEFLLHPSFKRFPASCVMKYLSCFCTVSLENTKYLFTNTYNCCFAVCPQSHGSAVSTYEPLNFLVAQYLLKYISLLYFKTDHVTCLCINQLFNIHNIMKISASLI